MESFKIREQEFELFSYTGEVLSQDKFSETHISGGGGGGTHGHSTNVRISSRVITKHDFWLKTDDGKEEPIQLVGHEVPLREGQRVTVVYVKSATKENGIPAMIINHSAKDFWTLINLASLKSLKLKIPVGGYIITWIIVSAFFGLVFKGGAGAGIGAFIGLILAAFSVNIFLGNKAKEVIADFNKQLSKVANDLLRK